MILQASTDKSDSVVLTVMASSLDISNANAFREECSPFVADSTGVVELDCSRLEFIDSSGVGALLHANKLLSADRRPVRLTGVGPKIMALLELMHVHRSFDLEPRR